MKSWPIAHVGSSEVTMMWRMIIRIIDAMQTLSRYTVSDKTLWCEGIEICLQATQQENEHNS